MKNACCTVGLAWFFLLCPLLANGQTLQKTEKELKQLQAEINNADRRVKDLKKTKQEIHFQLRRQEIEYGRLAKNVKDLESDVAELKNVLKRLRIRREAIKKSMFEHREELVKLLKAAYMNGRYEQVKLFLNQQDPALSSRILKYYDYFNKARMEKLNAIQRDLDDLLQLQQHSEQRRQQLALALEDAKHEQTALAAVRLKRQNLLKQIERRYSSQKKRLQQLRLSEKKLNQLIESLQRTAPDTSFEIELDKPFAKLKGRLSWPVSGRLAKKFGSARSESRWDGVLISAKEGNEIKAVSHGQVVYADWLRGYGLLTIIDHGKGFMTLYAFSQSLYKTEGEWVKAGDVIATVGKSGGRSQPALYFGVRNKGRPLDPVKWCRKTRNNRVG